MQHGIAPQVPMIEPRVLTGRELVLHDFPSKGSKDTYSSTHTIHAIQRLHSRLVESERRLVANLRDVVVVH